MKRKQSGRPLTDAFVDRMKQPGRYGDGRGTHGLSLLVKVRTNGRVARYWCQRARVNGQWSSIGLGNADLVTLTEAREAARDNARSLHQGTDPRVQAKVLPTFQEATEAVFEIHKATWRNPLTAGNWWSIMEHHAFPTIGGKLVADITSADVLSVVLAVWHDKQDTAKRLRQQLRAVFQYAVATGYRADNPAGEAIDGALPKNGKATKQHHRALDHSEVAEAIVKVHQGKAKRATKLMIEFVALTACRTNEARLADWTEFDMGAGIWTVPGNRMKQGKGHRVPLSDRAIAILETAKGLSGSSGLVFETAQGKALSPATARKALSDLSIPGTMHGFRSSFRSWCAEQNVTREVAESALAHTTGNATEQAYQRSDLFEARREIMERWAQHIS